MVDNVNEYVTYKELLDRLYPSTYVSYKGVLTLSNKSTNTFEYVSTLAPLEVGDIVCQGIYANTIITIGASPDTIVLDDGTNISNGTAYVYRSTETVEDLDMHRASAMQTIDLYTGQWFNKRTFEGASAIRLEGNNTHMMHFSIPIIEVTSLTMNDEDEAVDSESYNVFNSRAIPDDRRNPRIKMISRTNDIYRNNRGVRSGTFHKLRMQVIEGSFGFLEIDGSTPIGIKWATARLVMNILTTDLESTSSSSGRVKKEKVDMHEVEFFDDNVAKVQSGDMTGDEEVDRIIKMYKSPFAITGSDPLYRSIPDFYSDYSTRRL